MVDIIHELEELVDNEKKRCTANNLKYPVNLVFFEKEKPNIPLWLSPELKRAWRLKDPDFKLKVNECSFNEDCKTKHNRIRLMFNWLWKLKLESLKDHKLDVYEQIPTSDMVEKYVKIYEYKDNPSEEELEFLHYQKDFKTIAFLKSMLGNSNTREAVSIKACVVDTLYSTKNRDLSAVADSIASYDFLSEVQSNDIDKQAELVNKIVHIPGASKNYSFATKYCHLHNPDFAIYDSFAAGMIIFIHRRYKCIDSKNLNSCNRIEEIIPTVDAEKDWTCDELREFLQDYKTYKTAIMRIREVYNLIDKETLEYFTIDQMDKYLWGLGRAHDISDKTVEFVPIML